MHEMIATPSGIGAAQVEPLLPAPATQARRIQLEVDPIGIVRPKEFIELVRRFARAPDHLPAGDHVSVRFVDTEIFLGFAPGNIQRAPAFQIAQHVIRLGCDIVELRSWISLGK